MKNEKVILILIPTELANKLDVIPYFPEGIVNAIRIRSNNCRFLLNQSVERHIDKKTLILKEPINCSLQIEKCDTTFGFIISDELNTALNELKKHYLLTKKGLASLLICQEVKRQEERQEIR